MTVIGSVEVDESALEQVIADYLDNNSYMTHSGVTDVVEEHVKDNIDISGEIDEYMSGQDYQTESDVEDLISNHSFVDEDDVRNLIQEAVEALDIPDEGLTESEVRDLVRDEISGSLLDEDDVERIVSELDRNNPDRADLERRFEMYAQRVDDLLRDVKELGATVHDGGEKATEPTVKALLEANEALVARIQVLEHKAQYLGEFSTEDGFELDTVDHRLVALEQRQEIFAERLGDARVGDALTLMDLLRRAAAILGIGGRA